LPASGHLVIVPHDLLHYVPFQALHNGQSYVADTHTVSYAPSASIYALCCQRRAATGDRSLILGVPDERAPVIYDEVRAVAGLLAQPELRVGSAASLDALRESGAGSRMRHITPHGYCGA